MSGISRSEFHFRSAFLTEPLASHGPTSLIALNRDFMAQHVLLLVYRKPYRCLSNDRIGQVGAQVCFILAVLTSPFKSKSRIEAENAALRHQLVVLRRKLKGRARLADSDRWFFVQLYRWFPSILQFFHHHPPRDVGTLASGRVLPLSALEIIEAEDARQLMQSCVS